MSSLEFIDQLEGEQRHIMIALHEWFLGFPGVSTKMRYRVPFYDRKHWICYLNPLKDGGVDVNFIRADELSNANGLLDFKGRKQVAGFTVRHTGDIPEDALYEVFQEALLLDEKKPYTAPKTRNRT